MIWKQIQDFINSRTTAEPESTASSTQSSTYSPREDAYVLRPSKGLEQFFSDIRDQQGLSLLDFSGMSQANVGFITNLGHRLYTEDLIMALDRVFPDGDQSQPDKINQFIAEHANFRDYDYDGALLWDTLQFCSPALLPRLMDRLYNTLRPDSYLFAIFHTEERAGTVPVHSFRIHDGRQLMMAPRGRRRTGQPYNNRTIEKLFHQFQSVKFFLTRDNLREVVVRR